jgi:hypothetical protein
VHEPDPSAPPPPHHAAYAFAAGVALAGVALLVAECERPPTWRELAETRVALSRATAQHEVAPASKPLVPTVTLALERAVLPAQGPVRLSLALAEPSADAEPRPVTVVSIQDQRVFSTQGHLDAERMNATIDVPVDFLQPGTYLVQMKTTERTHFPLRRYAIEVH